MPELITYNLQTGETTTSEFIPPEIPPVPIEEIRAGMVVSRGQGRIALHRAEKLAALEAYISSPTADPEVVIAYQDAATWSRTSATTAALQQVLGLSDEETDDLFRAAALIEY